MTHTPGPWKVADRFRIYMDDDVGCEVASVCLDNLDDDMTGQADADARLIAAAPELLAALQQVFPWKNKGQPEIPPQGLCASWAAAYAVIAKAEGRE